MQQLETSLPKRFHISAAIKLIALNVTYNTIEY